MPRPRHDAGASSRYFAWSSSFQAPIQPIPVIGDDDDVPGGLQHPANHPGQLRSQARTNLQLRQIQQPPAESDTQHGFGDGPSDAELHWQSDHGASDDGDSAVPRDVIDIVDHIIQDAAADDFNDGDPPGGAADEADLELDDQILRHLGLDREIDDPPDDDPDDDPSDASDSESEPEAAPLLDDANDRDDPTTEIPHEAIQYDENTHPFALGFVIWQDEVRLSRTHYKSLVQLLACVRCTDELKSLPTWKGSVSKSLVKHLPLVKTRQAKLPVAKHKLPTRAELREPIRVLDMTDFFTKLLSSDEIYKHIYFGMAQRTDQCEELWQSRSWGESIRTTSGQFAHYPDDMQPILPSDFVLHRCRRRPRACALCRTETYHHGRVVWCGRDFTTQAATEQTRASKILLIQTVHPPGTMPPHLRSLVRDGGREADDDTVADDVEPIGNQTEDLIIIEDEEEYIPEDAIISRLDDVFLDYSYKPPKQSMPEGEFRYCFIPVHQRRSSKFNANPNPAKYVVQYIINKGTNSLRPLKLSSPHRGELEIRAFGREQLISTFHHRQCLSLPYLLYLDEFGVYRNMYRSLLGIYAILSFLPEELRSTRSGVVPVTLAPFGAQQADAIDCLHHLGSLDRGVVVTIRGEARVLCAPPLALVGDMPQQASLSGCLNHNALHGCRFCLVGRDEKKDLEFDILRKGRFHDDMLLARERIDEQQLSGKERNDVFRELGLKDKPEVMDAIMRITPALDMFRSRPPDPAHSEYQGLVIVSLRLLHEEILQPKQFDNFAEALARLQPPPNWKRIQSIKHHLESYSIQEAARASILVPVLLRIWLRVNVLQKGVWSRIRAAAAIYMRDVDQDNAEFSNPCALITLAYWRIAQSNLISCGRSSTIHKEAPFKQAIIRGRHALQFLLDVASYNSLGKQRDGPSNPRQAPRGLALVSQASMAGSQIMSSAPASELEDGSIHETQSQADSQNPQRDRASRALKWQRHESSKGLPNIHVGLHFWEAVKDFGQLRFIATLIGEDMHRKFKKDAPTTNHQHIADTLLSRESTRLTITMAFSGCFKLSHPALHAAFEELKQCAPVLTKMLNPRIDLLSGGGEELDQVAEWDLVVSDENHFQPAVNGRVHKNRQNRAGSRQDELLSVLSLKGLPHDHAFAVMLVNAFQTQYGKQRAVFLGNAKIAWWKQLSFSTKLVGGSRRCLRPGDIMRIRSGWLARLDGILTVRLSRASPAYIFVVSTAIRKMGEDPILQGVSSFEYDEQRIFGGLPSVTGEKVWLVRKAPDKYLEIPHDVYFI